MQFLVTTADNGEIDWKTKGLALKNEARYIWELASKGIVRNVWFTRETKDAILLVEADSGQSVRELMERAPLVAEGLITCKIEELRPYTGFERLFGGKV
jgi:hypothetical protein